MCTCKWVLSGVRVARSLAWWVCFVHSCLSFRPFFFWLWVVCSSIYGFWLSLWYPQTLLNYGINNTIWSWCNWEYRFVDMDNLAQYHWWCRNYLPYRNTWVHLYFNDWFDWLIFYYLTSNDKCFIFHEYSGR